MACPPRPTHGCVPCSDASSDNEHEEDSDATSPSNSKYSQDDWASQTSKATRSSARSNRWSLPPSVSRLSFRIESPSITGSQSKRRKQSCCALQREGRGRGVEGGGGGQES